MKLRLEQVSVDVEHRRIVDDVTVDIPTGSIVGVVGPNGSGKTTLLRTIYRTVRPVAGAVYLDGRNLSRLSARDAAREVAAVLQESSSDFDFRVEDVVAMGRTPHKRFFETDTDDDHRLIEDALEQVGIGHLSRRRFATLSGGEKQRALIARALVQQAQLLVLDEPTNHLDIRYQLEVMDLIDRFAITTVVALHDLNIAAAYCDTILTLCEGRVAAIGDPGHVLTPQLVRDVFGVDAAVVHHPVTGAPRLVFDSPAAPTRVADRPRSRSTRSSATNRTDQPSPGTKPCMPFRP